VRASVPPITPHVDNISSSKSSQIWSRTSTMSRSCISECRTSSHHTTAPPEPIAIIGMACRFAGGVSSPSTLWDLLASGRDAWTAIPKDRFDAASLYDANEQRTDRHHVKGGYFLRGDISAFDAKFFNLAADDAAVGDPVCKELYRSEHADVNQAMDPQLRMSLEGVYEALEDGERCPISWPCTTH